MQKPDEFTGPVNLGNPHECSIRELAEMVLEITGSKSKMEFLPLPPDDPRQRKPDITIARAELGYAFALKASPLVSARRACPSLDLIL